jgi:peptide/nickel transport system permease protein
LTDVLAHELPGGGVAPAPPVTDEVLGIAAESVSPGRMVVRRFLRHRAAVVAAIVLTLLILAAVLAPWITPYEANERVAESGALLLPPSSDYWFGTDAIGRDLFSRIIWGGRISLFIGISVAISAALIGTIIGAVAGYTGGKLDNILMRVTDGFLAFPLLVTLLIVRQIPDKQPWASSVLGPPGSIRLMVTLLSLVAWMVTARIVRGVVLSLREKEFIESARALGASNLRIIGKHLVPNSLGPIIVAGTLTVAGAIALESTISYFGFGVDPTTVSWGNLLSDSKGFIVQGKWWMVLFPSLVLLLTILAVNFMGDGLRDAFDPKQSKERA